MNQKDYKKIAKIIKELKVVVRKDFTPNVKETKRELANEFADYFKKEEPVSLRYSNDKIRFIRKQFLKLAGVEE